MDELGRMTCWDRWDQRNQQWRNQAHSIIWPKGCRTSVANQKLICWRRRLNHKHSSIVVDDAGEYPADCKDTRFHTRGSDCEAVLRRSVEMDWVSRPQHKGKSKDCKILVGLQPPPQQMTHVCGFSDWWSPPQPLVSDFFLMMVWLANQQGKTNS